MSVTRDDDEAPRSHPYRTPVEVPEAPSSKRTPKARVLSALAGLSAARGEDDVSEALSRRAEDARSRESSDVNDQTIVLRRVARAAFDHGRWRSAETSYRHVVVLQEQAGGPLLDDLITLATTLRRLSLWDESEPIFRRVTALREPLKGEAPIIAVHDLAVLYVHLGRLADARTLLEQAMERATEVVTQSPSDLAAAQDVARVHHALAECLLDQGDLFSARNHVDRALALRRELDGTEHPLFGAALATAGRAMHVAGDHALAELSFARAIELMKQPLCHSIGSAHAMVMLASLYVDAGRLDDAERLIRGALHALEDVGPDHAFLCRGLRVRARIERLRGTHEHPTTTEATIARILALWWSG